jgi:serine protease inhibitor
MQNVFALDLYSHLRVGAQDDNLFFSPYSVFTALAMTAEGARGQTAEEMGRVLRLPGSLRRRGGGAAERPWNFEGVHSGLAALSRTLEMPGTDGPARTRLDSLRAEFAAANAEAVRGMRTGDFESARQAHSRASSLAGEVNALAPLLEPYDLQTVNAIWADQSTPPRPEFLASVTRYYGAQAFEPVDFRGAPEAARLRINDWVAERTLRRIVDLLGPGSVNRLTRLILANAVYFRGEWREVFAASATKPARFHEERGESAQVDMMRAELRRARYAAFTESGSPFATPARVAWRQRRDDTAFYPGPGGFQLLELPYRGGGVSMILLLPCTATGLRAIERSLDAGRLARWMAALDERRVDVMLPRFRLEQGHDLVRDLGAMGMPRAFDSGAAQFDGMLSPGPGDGLPFIGDVVQKAFLEVNEKGTEAAAATAVEVMESEYPEPELVPFVPRFYGDHPFLFLIRDVRSGCILFMGRFARP